MAARSPYTPQYVCLGGCCRWQGLVVARTRARVPPAESCRGQAGAPRRLALRPDAEVMLRRAQGLALPRLNKTGVAPVFFNMIAQRMLDIPVFGVWLNPDPTMEPAGSIRFGNVDPARYEGGITDLPVRARRRPHALFACRARPGARALACRDGPAGPVAAGTMCACMTKHDILRIPRQGSQKQAQRSWKSSALLEKHEADCTRRARLVGLAGWRSVEQTAHCRLSCRR